MDSHTRHDVLALLRPILSGPELALMIRVYGMDDQGQPITLPEAARDLSCSVRTVERRARRALQKIRQAPCRDLLRAVLHDAISQARTIGTIHEWPSHDLDEARPWPPRPASSF